MIDPCRPLEDSPEPHDPAPSPETLTIQSDFAAHVRQLFATLLPYGIDAAVMAELYLEDMTGPEVAARHLVTHDQINHIRRKSLRVLRHSREFLGLLKPPATTTSTSTS